MDLFSPQDCAHMARALQLAERGRFTAHPNPVVGCVVARAGDIVGEGWHVRTGEAHAEVNALREAGDRAHGATAYVTLEPCAHTGRTPPCADALLAAGVARAVVAMPDPNSLVAGKGIERLRSAGVDVETGLMASAASAQNPGFISRMSRGRPWVRLKMASSLDGATAMASGESQWITGQAARRDVQRQRARCGAIMTGIGTVLADDPSLNVRDAGRDAPVEQPLRVVLDSMLRMPLAAAMLSLPGQTLVCCSGTGPQVRQRIPGAEVRAFSGPEGKVDIGGVLRELASREINEVLVEAGAQLSGSLLSEGLVDEVVIYQAPVLMGGETVGMAETPSWTSLSDRRTLKITDVRRVGDDTRITGLF